MKFKSRLWRLMLVFLAGYIVLFAVRLIYGYVAYPDGQPQRNDTAPARSDYFESVSKKNYAGSKHEVAGHQSTVDQKYEKIASLYATTEAFDAEEKKIRSAVQEHQGIIQSENGRGIEGKRLLNLVIGIQPAQFDTFVAIMKSVGTLRSLEISKSDKTNEFLDLKAQRVSLEKTRTALMELRSQGGRVDELMHLQNRILEIEGKLQNLGVMLGDFDEVNAFCTVKFTLSETRAALKSGTSPGRRVKVAAIWAAEIYTGLIGMLCLTMLAAFITLLTVDRFNIVRRVASTLESTGETKRQTGNG